MLAKHPAKILKMGNNMAGNYNYNIDDQCQITYDVNWGTEPTVNCLPEDTDRGEADEIEIESITINDMEVLLGGILYELISEYCYEKIEDDLIDAAKDSDYNDYRE